MGCGKDSGDTLWILDKFGAFSQRVAGGWETKLSLNHGNGLFVDKQDNVWILLGNSGLLRYKAGELKNWSNVLNPDAEDYIPGHNLFDMVQNGDGLYWVASDYGLFRFDGTSFLQAFNAENSGIASRRTRCLAIGRDGALWIGTWDGGVSKFDGANWVNYNVKNSPLESNLINSIVVDDAGKVWISSGYNNFVSPARGNGVFVFDENAVVGNGSPPSAPKDLTITPISVNEVKLQWTDVDDTEAGYLIERSLDGVNFEQIKFVLGNTTTFTDLTVTGSETYFYRVRATNTAGLSDYSNTESVRPRYCPVDKASYDAYAITTRVDFGDIHHTSFNCINGYYDYLDHSTSVFRGQTINLSFAIDRCRITSDPIIGAEVYIDWNADGDFDDSGERVFQNLNIEGNGQYNIPLTVPDVVVPGTIGRLRFRADDDTYSNINPCGYAEETQDYTVRFSEEEFLGKPTPLQAEAVGARKINIAWQDNASAEEGYLIQRSFDGVTFQDLTTTNANTISFADESLTPGKTAYYRVLAIKGSESSPVSDVVSATTLTVDFVRVQDGDFYDLTAFGVGGSWIDYDGDNDLDLYCTGTDFLFRNDSNLLNNSALQFWTSGQSSWADFDNDGDPDLLTSTYLYSWGPESTILYINNGGDSFTKVDLETEGRSTNPVWVDFDRDGHLDIFLPYLDQNYGRFYRNNRDHTFTAGEQIPKASGFTSFGDYDNDEDDDLLSFNSNGVVFYVNNGDGTFTEASNVLPNIGWMTPNGASWGDFNNDGHLDIFVTCGTHYDCTNTLYINNGKGNFYIASPSMIEYSGGQSYGSAWQDFDNDGCLDLVVANFQGVNFLYRNQGNGTFERILRGAIPEEYGAPEYEKSSSMGCAWGDYNRDGFVDLVIFNNNGMKSFLYANQGNENNWISLSLIGEVSNRSAIGATVKIKVNDTWQTRLVTPQSGFAGQNSLDVEFGLGTATTVDRVEIKWPSGIQQTLVNVRANQFLTIVESEDVTAVDRHLTAMHPYPNPASNYVMIRGIDSFSKMNAFVTDMTGVVRDVVEFSNPDGLLIDIEPLPPGPYILSLSDGTRVQRWKLIRK